MHDPSGYVGILLAAGQGRRFDPTGRQNKLAQRLDSGELVAARAALAMRAVLSRVVAVVRPEGGIVGDRLSALGCEVIACHAADDGMGTSLAFAVSHAQHAKGWIIGLADMPYVKAASIHALLDTLVGGADIAVPVYQGRRGNPVGFSRKHLAALMSMNGDRGARRLVDSFPVNEVAVEDAGIHLDIDTAADLAASATGR
jgi:molybdenum cofactor cytidylyltransferase